METGIRERKQAAVDELTRWQIVEAFANVASAKGYAATTITDIVAAARMSKSTFYDQFADKERAYLHLHAVVADAATTAMADSIASTTGIGDRAGRIEHLIGAYLDCMAGEPAFLAQIRLEPQVASGAAVAARRAASSRFLTLIARLDRETSDGGSLPEPIAVAGLAGTLELLRRAAEQSPDAVRELRPVVSDLWLRLAAQ